MHYLFARTNNVTIISCRPVVIGVSFPKVIETSNIVNKYEYKYKK